MVAVFQSLGSRKGPNPRACDTQQILLQFRMCMWVGEAASPKRK